MSKKGFTQALFTVGISFRYFLTYELLRVIGFYITVIFHHVFLLTPTRFAGLS